MRCVTRFSGSAFTVPGFDAQQTSDVKARLRFILPILPKSMRSEYDRMGGDDAVASSDRGFKSTMGLVECCNSTDRIISVISGFVPGFASTKWTPCIRC